MKKINLYADTNMILDIFINHAKALKNRENVLVPKKYEFMLANRAKVNFISSFIVKAEVARELASGFALPLKDIETLWNDFVKSVDCKFVDSFTFDSKISDFAARSQMKLRTLFNFMHIFIAMDQNCYFVSGDKDLIKKIRLLLDYEKAIDYIELRKLVEGES